MAEGDYCAHHSSAEHQVSKEPAERGAVVAMTWHDMGAAMVGSPTDK